MKTRLKSLSTGIATLGLLTLPHLSAADVTAVFDVDGETMTIEYRDDQNVRMRAPGDSYLMRQNDEVYVITREGGDWQVLALSDFAAMLGGMASNMDQEQTLEEMQEGFEFRDTGRTEVVAGIRGTVHEVIETDSRGREEIAAEVVLSDDAAAVQAYRGMISIITAMGQMAGQQGLGELLDSAYGGENRAVLRSNDDWRLVSVNEDRIPDNYFVLPAEPTTIPGFGGFGGSSRSSGNDGQAPNVDADAAGSWLENFSEELGRSAAEEAQQETERGVTESVRDGIRDGIRGIFGR